jgi:hypothetical protein
VRGVRWARAFAALAAHRAFVGALVGAAVCAACGSSGPPPVDPALVRADAAALTAAVARDPAPQILGEADGMIDDRRPVRAAEVLRTAALPAVRRQLERVAVLRLRTGEGRALQERAGRAYRRRSAAIERYAAALARGEIEDDELLASVRAHREAEEEVLAVIEAAQALGQPPRPASTKRSPSAGPAVE